MMMICIINSLLYIHKDTKTKYIGLVIINMKSLSNLALVLGLKIKERLIAWPTISMYANHHTALRSFIIENKAVSYREGAAK